MQPSEFIAKLCVHFAPRHDSPEVEAAWFSDMVREVRGVDGATLEKAARRIIANRKLRSFPLVSEIVEACNYVAPARTPASYAGPTCARRWVDPEAESRTALAQAWQKEQFDAHGPNWTAEVNKRINVGKAMASKKSTFKPVGSLSSASRRMTGERE